jgi:hypothetical protein
MASGSDGSSTRTQPRGCGGCAVRFWRCRRRRVSVLRSKWCCSQKAFGPRPLLKYSSTTYFGATATLACCMYSFAGHASSSASNPDSARTWLV